MATSLPTNFVNDVLSADMDGKRRYTKIDNSDGTISLTDSTVYDVEGSTFGASQINATNEAINQVSATLDTTNATINSKLPSSISGFSVGTDGKPYITYKVGADTVTKKLGEAKNRLCYVALNNTGNVANKLQYDSDIFDIRDNKLYCKESGTYSFILDYTGRVADSGQSISTITLGIKKNGNVILTSTTVNSQYMSQYKEVSVQANNDDYFEFYMITNAYAVTYSNNIYITVNS